MGKAIVMTMVLLASANVQIALQLYMADMGYLVSVNKGQLLHECSISVVHDWSGLSCNGK